jgi:hypothetical protein
VGADAGSEQTHGYGVTSGIGATSIEQPIDTQMITESGYRAAYEALNVIRDNVGEKDVPGEPFIPGEKKDSRVNKIPTVHCTEGRSSDAAADTGPRPLTPDQGPHTGGDVRHLTPDEVPYHWDSTGRPQWDRAFGSWWSRNNEWSSRWSNR